MTLAPERPTWGVTTLGRSCPIRPRRLNNRRRSHGTQTSRGHRTRCGLGALGCFALAAAYIAEAWRIVFTLRIGPVIAVIDEAHGHGIHSGDMLGLGCAILAVALVVGGAILLDDAAGSAAHLAPTVVRSRSRSQSRHRRALTAVPVMAVPVMATAATPTPHLVPILRAIGVELKCKSSSKHGLPPSSACAETDISYS